MARRQGLALIELLVVIAIIALLVSLLLPSLRTAKHLANQAVCAGNTHHVAIALHVYADDWDGWVPGSRNWEAHPRGRARAWHPEWKRRRGSS